MALWSSASSKVTARSHRCHRYPACVALCGSPVSGNHRDREFAAGSSTVLASAKICVRNGRGTSKNETEVSRKASCTWRDPACSPLSPRCQAGAESHPCSSARTRPTDASLVRPGPQAPESMGVPPRPAAWPVYWCAQHALRREIVNARDDAAEVEGVPIVTSLPISDRPFRVHEVHPCLTVSKSAEPSVRTPDSSLKYGPVMVVKQRTNFLPFLMKKFSVPRDAASRLIDRRATTGDKRTNGRMGGCGPPLHPLNFPADPICASAKL